MEQPRRPRACAIPNTLQRMPNLFTNGPSCAPSTARLLRDLWHLRSQVLAIAVVIMGGVANLIMALSTYESLYLTRERFYRDYAFADVLVGLKRAPESVAKRIARTPRRDAADTRVRAGVNLSSRASPTRSRAW